jgi:hypothetical protein
MDGTYCLASLLPSFCTGCHHACQVFNASRDRGQVIHLFSEEAKQLLHLVTGLREAVRSM